MKHRLPKLARRLAGIYLGWSLLVFICSLLIGEHDIWKVLLYPFIWPVSAFYEIIISPMLLAWLVTDPKTAPSWLEAFLYCVDGSFYVVVGTIWVWLLGCLVSMISANVLPIRDDKPMA
jgi:hypothetical protein